ncbi:UPF0176 protein [Rhodococcus sp. SMB37]|nr:UPF0176 protein [Rhodococcus sp. SMB37]
MIVAVPKIVLFYKFTALPDPEAMRLWQHTLAASNGLTGRILVSEHGINGTVGGNIDAVKKYVRGLRSYPAFRDVDVKWSDGTGDDFPRLSVKVRPEIVTFGAPDEVKVDENGVVGGGTHLSPHAVHALMTERDDVVFFDGRNKLEAQIGRFRDAVVPEVDTTRDFVAELDSGRYDHLKSKPVVTYCTGGVRCEVLSVLMRNRGFEEVYQLDGGIVRYGETFGDAGLWEGSLYVFDGRMNVEFSEDAVTLGRCTMCGTPTSRYRNHPDVNGRELTLVCEGCVPDTTEAGA